MCNGGVAEGKVDLVTGSSEDGLAPAFMETSVIVIEDAWCIDDKVIHCLALHLWLCREDERFNGELWDHAVLGKCPVGDGHIAAPPGGPVQADIVVDGALLAADVVAECLEYEGLSTRVLKVHHVNVAQGCEVPARW